MFRLGASTFKDLATLRKAVNIAKDRFPALWRKALEDAGDIALKYLGRQFVTEGKEFGTPWPSLKKATEADRKRKGYKPSHPILVRRGWLRASVISKTSANHRRIVTDKGIVMESTLKTKGGYSLFLIHHEGTSRIPARRIISQSPPFISQRGWREIQARFAGMFIELRREMENATSK